MEPKLFQIGFNKTATTALFWLFINSGHSALHSSGRRARLAGHPVVSKLHPQLVIHHNICAGRPAVQGLEDFDAHFDMEHDLPNSPIKIENFKFFDRLARDYPRAKFVLNVRECDAWVMSRARHNDGQYLKRSMARLAQSEAEVLDQWRDEHARHHNAVRAFFAAEQDRLLVFDIDRDPIDTLVDFCAPDFALDPAQWGKARVTDDVVQKLGWERGNAQ
ncbi:sulfotransferase [Celeribacter marinus]|uniref:sulfotransferase n=1 Tax=Celeribacter marinus TaxID=1397108 RepID=UPI000782CD50|nr:sulfotransferase [Celeribacter marinus]SFK30324.1 hypothetical protein SAMN05444421_1034 [Celeribacter marinus]